MDNKFFYTIGLGFLLGIILLLGVKEAQNYFAFLNERIEIAIPSDLISRAF